MFKVPEWEDDTEKSNLNFVNNIKKKKKNKKTEISNNHDAANKTIENKVVNNADLLANSNNKKPTKHKNNVTDTLRNKVNKNKRKQIKHTKLLQSSNNVEVAKQHCTNRKKKRQMRKKKSSESDNNLVETEIKNGDDDKLDEILLDARKKKFNDNFNNEETLFSNQDTSKTTAKPENTENGRTKKVVDGHTISKPTQSNRKFSKNKEIIKSMLNKVNQRNHIEVSGNQLRDRMLNRLKAAQFRYLNEKLYTSSGGEAQSLFQEDPVAFHTYHQGYQQQLKKWPVNPLDVIVKKILEMPKSHVIADMGCGEGALAGRVPHRVRSFDLVSVHAHVEACDMAHTPLLAATVDVAVYCLALMGTDLTQYLLEANRVLKVGGHLLVAEVESRFEDPEAFAREVQRLGFKLRELDTQHQVFFFFHFSKLQQAPVKKSKFPKITLKPCLYKKR